MGELIKRENQTDQRNQQCAIEIMDIETGLFHVVKSFDEVVEAPNWSKDGSALIYNSKGLIFSYNLNDGNIQQIDTGFANFCNNDHIISTSGKQLGISHMTDSDLQSRIYILPFEGGTPRLITKDGLSFLHGWSPDETLLAYTKLIGNDGHIFTIGIDGKDEKQLTHGKGLDDGSEFSPDGKHIWFNSTRSGLMQIWKMDLEGNQVTKISDSDQNCWFPHVSPDGKKVVYIAYKKNEVQPGDHPADKRVQIRLMDIDGTNDHVISSFIGGQGSMNVNSWSPDSKKFAYVTYGIHLELD